MPTDAFPLAKLDAIFAATLDLEPGERPAFLDRSCGDDVELRHELDRLLRAAATPSGPLENRELLLGPLAVSSTAGSPPFPGIGDRVGAYRLIDEIGRGGMGMVYLAERADREYQQRAVNSLVGSRYRGGPAVPASGRSGAARDQHRPAARWRCAAGRPAPSWSGSMAG
jgi:serine/threonine-protein kinase